MTNIHLDTAGKNVQIAGAKKKSGLGDIDLYRDCAMHRSNSIVRHCMYIARVHMSRHFTVLYLRTLFYMNFGSSVIMN